MGERAWEYRGYWLGREAGSQNWYACWYDAGRRKTRRRSLKSSDFAQAQQGLVEFVEKRERPVNAGPRDVAVSAILLPYLEDVADRKAADNGSRGCAAFIVDFFETARVSDLTPQRQREFILHLGGKGHSPGYINKTMSVLSASLGHARNKGELMATPKIIMAKTAIAEIVQRPAASKLRRLSPKELAALLDAIKAPHVFRFVITALNTVARAEAITDLVPIRQVDWEMGRIDLNPPGRMQTKKLRPIVPLTPTLAAWLRVWKPSGHLVTYHAKPIAEPLLAIRRAAETAGLVTADDVIDGQIRSDRSVTPRTLRRSMARLLRGKGVPMEDIGAMLGHQQPDASTTEVFYADAAPDYLQRAIDGIEAIMDEIASHTQRAPVRPFVLGCTQNAPKSSAVRRIYGI